MNKYLKLFISIIPALVILTGAILFFNYYPRFDIVGDDLIKFGNFEEIVSENSKPLSFLDKWSGWNENTKWVKNGGFNNTAGILLQSKKKKRCKLKLNLLGIDKYYPLLLLFKVKAKSENIIRGKEYMDKGRILMYFKDQNKKTINEIKKNVVSFGGSQPWKEYYRIFTIPKHAKSIRIFLRNYGLSGTLYVDDLSLQPVIFRQSFKNWRFILGTLLFLIFIAYLWKMRIYHKKYGFLLLILILFIIIFVLIPEDSLTQITDSFFQITGITENQVSVINSPSIYSLKDSAINLSNFSTIIHSLIPQSKYGNTFTDKDNKLFFLKDKIKTLGHFLFFTILSWISCLSFLKESIYTNYSKSNNNEMLFRYFSMLLYLTIFAIFTEVIQYFSPSRFPNMDDLGIDLLGIFLGLFLFYTYNYFKISKVIK